MDKQYLWTIVIIVQKDKDSVWEYRELIKSIERVRFNPRIKYVILQFDQDFRHARVKTTGRSQKTFYNRIEKIKGSEKMDFCLTCKDDLGEFFGSYVKEYALNSERSILITWGHGAGLGFFDHVEQAKTKAKTANISDSALLFENKSMQVQREVSLYFMANSVGQKESNPVTPLPAGLMELTTSNKAGKNLVRKVPRAISAEEIASIIQERIAKDYKIDFFIANNCYMQMAEVCVDLAASFKVFIASQNSIPFGGIYYEELFGCLSQLAEERSVCENVMDFFQAKYSASTEFGKLYKTKRPEFDPRGLSLNAIGLGDINTMISIVNEVGSVLVKELDHAKELSLSDKYADNILKKARSYCISDPRLLGSIDFETFLRELIKAHELLPILNLDDQQAAPFIQCRNELKEQFGLFSDFRTNSILASLTPAKLHYTDFRSSGTISSLGFSVFYPSEVDNSISEIGTLIKNTFYFNGTLTPNGNQIIEGAWGSFLKKILI